MHAYGYAFKSHGTIAEVTIYADRADGQKETIDEIRAWLEGNEKRFSRFSPDSSLNQLVRHGKIPLEGDFAELVRLAKKYSKATNGYFNPTVDLAGMGYGTTFERIDTGTNETERARAIADTLEWVLEIDGDWITLKPGHSIDFWAIAKGYAIDRISDLLGHRGFDTHIVNVWGDLRARGDVPFTIAIQDPFATNGLMGDIEVRNRAVLTSGTYVRHWRTESGLRHHIVNPHTGKNDTDLVSITLLAETATEWDALSTAMLAMGMDRARSFAEKQGLDCLLISADGERVTIGGVKFDFVEGGDAT